MSATTAASSVTRRRWSSRQIFTALQHVYIWIWLVLFALPFVVTVLRSIEGAEGGHTLFNYRDIWDDYQGNLWFSVKVTIGTIIINLLVAIPGAYAIVRYAVPGKRFVLSLLNLALYTPGAVAGISLVITYSYLFDIPRTVTGLVAAYVVGTYPLMLVPIIVALRDLPTMYEEAARTLGANRSQSLLRVELPLLGPGISAGVLLTFVIVFNEFLVTLFIAGPHTTTAALTVYNLTRTGFLPSTAALAAVMQFISFMVVLIFFKTFGSRYLKGTFLI